MLQGQHNDCTAQVWREAILTCLQMWTGQNHRTKMDDLWWLKILKITNCVAPFVTHTRISVVRFRLSPQRQGRSKYQFGPGWCPQALKTIQPSSHCKHQHFSRSALGCNKYACIYAPECIFTYIYIIYNDNVVKRPKLWQRNRYQNYVCNMSSCNTCLFNVIRPCDCHSTVHLK